MARSLLAFICELPALHYDFFHQAAERQRAQVYGYRAQLVSEGWPAGYAKQRGQSTLAWADLLDALAGKPRHDHHRAP